jgi:hypothetical protein
MKRISIRYYAPNFVLVLLIFLVYFQEILVYWRRSESCAQSSERTFLTLITFQLAFLWRIVYFGYWCISFVGRTSSAVWIWPGRTQHCQRTLLILLILLITWNFATSDFLLHVA